MVTRVKTVVCVTKIAVVKDFVTQRSRSPLAYVTQVTLEITVRKVCVK